MADKVQVQVAGGTVKTVEGVETVADIRSKLSLGDGYTASIKGEPANEDDSVEDYDYVSFTPKVKGGKH